MCWVGLYWLVQRWMFSTAFDAIRNWQFTDQPSMSDHLKVWSLFRPGFFTVQLYTKMWFRMLCFAAVNT